MKLLFPTTALSLAVLSGANSQSWAKLSSSNPHKTNLRGLADTGGGGLPGIPGARNCSWSKVQWNLAYPDWSTFYSVMELDLEEGQSIEMYVKNIIKLAVLSHILLHSF